MNSEFCRYQLKELSLGLSKDILYAAFKCAAASLPKGVRVIFSNSVLEKLDTVAINLSVGDSAGVKRVVEQLRNLSKDDLVTIANYMLGGSVDAPLEDVYNFYKSTDFVSDIGAVRVTRYYVAELLADRAEEYLKWIIDGIEEEEDG